MPSPRPPSLYAICLLGALAVHAEVVDRIAVSVANQVITEDQIREEIRVTAYLNHKQPQFTTDEKKAAAERLIQQVLLKREMDYTKFPLPNRDEAVKMANQIRADHTLPPDIAADELTNHLLLQLATLRFIEYRFQPSVQVPDTEIRNYYEKMRAEWETQGVDPPPALDDARADIEKILIQQRVDQAVDRWLGETRTQVEIRYHQEAFQ